VDTRQVDWAGLPRLVVTYEPAVGVRIFDNPLAAGDAGASADDRVARVRDLWAETFGREPRIHRTAPLADVLRSAGRELTSRGVAGRAPVAPELERIERAGRIQTGGGGSAHSRIELIDLLEEILASPHGDAVAPWLQRSEPFAIQGGRETGAAFLVVADPAITPATLWQELERLPGPLEVRLDMARLRPASWRRLPAAILLRQTDGYRVVWNHHSELNSEQVQRLGRSSWMVHRYAQRIAERWESETGMRPEVHATCYVSLNNREPSLLIDPQADLARAPMRYLRHNPWILAEGQRR
jgi:hypothetical protein